MYMYFNVLCLDSDESRGLEDSSEEGCCWVCQGVIEDNSDLFYPCNCKLHKKCIKEWVAKVRWGIYRYGRKGGRQGKDLGGGGGGERERELCYMYLYSSREHRTLTFQRRSISNVRCAGGG